LVKEGLSKMDNTALTTLVDWWRLETHTFHLPVEMTINFRMWLCSLGFIKMADRDRQHRASYMEK
jgi:hypothetical protein